MVVLVTTTAIGASAWALFVGRGGYDDRGLVQITVDFEGRAGGAVLPHDAKVRMLDRLVEQIVRRPGVQAAAYADALPDQQGGQMVFLSAGPGGRRDPQSGRVVRAVSPGLFEVLRIPILSGRAIGANDSPPAERVAVLNRSYVRTEELGGAIGRSLRVGTGNARIVGTVPDTRIFPVGAPMPTAYTPFAIAPRFAGIFTAEVVARFHETPSTEQTLALGRLPPTVDPSFRTLRASTVRDRRSRQLGAPLLAAAALAIFSAAGLLLAVCGGIGHVADFVARQAQAIAIRAALGADPHHIVWITCRRVALASLVGATGGGVVGWLVCRFMASRVPWITSGDPILIVGPSAIVLLLMMVTSGIAGLRSRRIAIWATLRSL